MSTSKEPVVVVSRDEKAEDEVLVAQFGRLVVDEAKKALLRGNNSNKAKPRCLPNVDQKSEKAKRADRWNPADFCRMQSVRTGALARHQETTSKFGGSAPYEGRQQQQQKKKDDIKETKEDEQGKIAVVEFEGDSKRTKDDTDEGYGDETESATTADGELIARTPGPIRGAVGVRGMPNVGAGPYHQYHHPNQHHPHERQRQTCGYATQDGNQYSGGGMPPYNCNYQSPPYPQQQYAPPPMGTYSAYSNQPHYNQQQQMNGYAYERQGPAAIVNAPAYSNNANGEHNESTFEDVGCLKQPASSGIHRLRPEDLHLAPMCKEDFEKLLDNTSELPEALSDFILQYSRRYTTTKTSNPTSHDRPNSRRSSVSADSQETGATNSSPCHLSSRPTSAGDSGWDSGSPASSRFGGSPMSAGSVPQASPAAPLSANAAPGPTTPTTPTAPGILSADGRSPKQQQKGRGAKEARDRLRAMFNEEQMAEAWAWAIKCTRNSPGNMYYCDSDGDSLLHICVWHKDLPKIYALVEQMLKSIEQPTYCQPFDIPNRLHETPLFLAVEKRAVEVVAYLLEAGADARHRSQRPGGTGDAPLHFAASRGMTEIVMALTDPSVVSACIGGSRALLDQQNAAGATPLICAVRNHGVIEEESQCLVNNKPVIRTLLKAGADAKVQDATNGRTVLHYAVERMDPELIQIFHANMDGQSVVELVSVTNFNGETPLEMLQHQRTQASVAGLVIPQAEEEIRAKMYMSLLSAATNPVDDICVGQTLSKEQRERYPYYRD